MSKSRSQAARRNGAKSHGPVTAQGKAVSSKNALRHGLTSKMIVLPHEDPEAFEQLRADYVHDFQPANRSQLDLVETMAAARWRINRMLELEERLFEKELCLRDEDIAEEIKNIDQPGKLAWCLDKMVNESKAFATLIRYEGQLNRTYQRAFQQLQALQRSKPNTPQPLPESRNEPKPTLIAPQIAVQPAPKTPSAPAPSPTAAASPGENDQGEDN